MDRSFVPALCNPMKAASEWSLFTIAFPMLPTKEITTVSVDLPLLCVFWGILSRMGTWLDLKLMGLNWKHSLLSVPYESHLLELWTSNDWIKEHGFVTYIEGQQFKIRKKFNDWPSLTLESELLHLVFWLVLELLFVWLPPLTVSDSH